MILGVNLKLSTTLGSLSRFESFLSNLRNTRQTPGGFMFLQEWGSARHNMNSNFLNLVDAQRRNQGTNRNFATDQLNYILGHGPSGSALLRDKSTFSYSKFNSERFFLLKIKIDRLETEPKCKALECVKKTGLLRQWRMKM